MTHDTDIGTPSGSALGGEAGLVDGLVHLPVRLVDFDLGGRVVDTC
jgi:hypothetical protein